MRVLSTAVLLVVTVVMAVLLASAAQPEKPAERPMNVLFVLSDDQRADAIGAHGNGQIRTPAIDSLVARGTSFLNAYCMGSYSGAVCSPSRAMMLTGRGLNRFKEPYAPGGEIVTLPEHFRAAGYDTFFSGKWHSSKDWFRRGFTHGGSVFFGGMGSHTELMVHDFNPSGEYPNKARRPLAEFSSAEFVTRGVEFLRARDTDRPFFMQVSFTGPHDPRTPPGEYATMYDPEELDLPPNFMPVHPFDNGEMLIRDEMLAPWPRTTEDTRRHLAAYYGMISHMDAQIGRLLDELDRLGLRQSTIVVFASDHGLAIGSHGLMGKQNLYEHSMKAPLIVVDPRFDPEGADREARGGRGSECEGLVYLHDIVPTMTDLAGLNVPVIDGERASSGSAGRSLAGCVGGCVAVGDGDGVCVGRRVLMTAYKDLQRSVRDDRWKLIVYPKINRAQLFDLQNDPSELTDLSGEMPGEVEQLTASLKVLQAWAGEGAELASERPGSGVFDHESAEAKRVERDGGRAMSWKARFLWLFLGSIALTVVVALSAIVYDGMPFQEEVLFTVFMFAVHSLAALLGAVLWQQKRSRRMVWSGVVTLCVGGLIWVGVFWAEEIFNLAWRTEREFHRVAGSFTAVGLMLLHRGLVRWPTSKKASVKWLSRAAWWCGFGSVGAILLQIWNLDFGIDEDGWVKLIASLMTVGAGCSIAVFVVARLVQEDLVEHEDSELSRHTTVLIDCPRCGHGVTLPANVRRACPGCKLKIKVEFKEPRCGCGYLLYGLTGDICPECGRSIPDTERWEIGLLGEGAS